MFKEKKKTSTLNSELRSFLGMVGKSVFKFADWMRGEKISKKKKPRKVVFVRHGKRFRYKPQENSIFFEKSSPERQSYYVGRKSWQKP